MSAWIVEDPLGVACVFSDGSTAAFGLEGLPCPRLAADLLAGLVELIHPHGTVDAAGSVNHYVQSIRDMTRKLGGLGFTGGAADLRRAQLAQYWMAATGTREACTRRMLRALPAAGGRLDAAVVELAGGRAFNPQRNHRQLPPYRDAEWAQLGQICGKIVDDGLAAHKRALTAAAHGQHRTRAGGRRRTCGGCWSGSGRCRHVCSPSTWAAPRPRCSSAAASARPAGSCSRTRTS